MSSHRVSVRTSITITAFAVAGLASLAGLGLSGCVQRVESQTPVAPASTVVPSPDETQPVPPPPPAPPTYPSGTRIAGVDVGGQTQDWAGHLVRLALKPMAARKLTLRYGKRAYPRTWEDLGIAPDTEAMLAQAWSTPDVPVTFSVDLARAKRSIRRAARALDVRPVAPRFVGEPEDGIVKEGKSGRKVNVHASALRLKEAIASDPKTATSPLVVVEDAPDFTAADLEQIRQPVVTYTTRFNPGDVSRTHNLRLVASRLNGALIPPGGTFSFNGWVGERRPEEGFREAIVYKQGKMVKDTAGGLCQVSSTLYNVALLAGLPIVERSNHSLTVTYVPLGRDATVYWGQRDLRFRNDTDTPLYIRARTGRRTLTIEAWGAAPLKRKVTVTSSASRRGGAAFAQVYRTVVENGTKTRSRISSDMYSTVHSMADRPVRSSRRSRD